MDVQFELPSRRDVSKCVVTKDTIEQGLRADARHPGRAGRGRAEELATSANPPELPAQVSRSATSPCAAAGAAGR